MTKLDANLLQALRAYTAAARSILSHASVIVRYDDDQRFVEVRVEDGNGVEEHAIMTDLAIENSKFDLIENSVEMASFEIKRRHPS